MEIPNKKSVKIFSVKYETTTILLEWLQRRPPGAEFKETTI